jgi:hypothetical protein
VRYGVPHMPLHDRKPPFGADECPNCGTPFATERRPFCPECGQETNIAPPRPAEFVQQFGGAYFSTEGALWRTLKLLVMQPGELTRRYLAGQRKHFVLPLRLYLSASVLLLLVVRLVAGAEVVTGLDSAEIKAAERGPMHSLTLELFGARLGVRKDVFVCERLPELLCETVRERAAPDARTLLAKLRRANERVVANFGFVMAVLLPLFTLCLSVVNHGPRGPRGPCAEGRPMGYTEHLVFALHLHAFWCLVLVATLFVPAPWHWAGLGWIVIYTLLAGSRAYGGGLGPRLARAMLLTLVYTALLAVTVPAAWLLGLLW